MNPNFPPARTQPVTVLVLTLVTLDDEGQEMTTTTWTSGPNEHGALRAWKRHNPVLAANLRQYDVLTPKPKTMFRDHQRLKLPVWTSRIGDRVEVRDVALETCAAGL